MFSVLGLLGVWVVERIRAKTTLGFWRWTRDTPLNDSYDVDDIPGI